MKKLSLLFLLLVCLCAGNVLAQEKSDKIETLCKNSQKSELKNKAVTFNVIQTSLQNFLNRITEQTGCQFVLDKEVEELLNDSLISVIADEAFWSIRFVDKLESLGLGIVIKDEIYRIAKITTLYDERRKRGEIICPIDPECPVFTEKIKLKYLPNNEIDLGKEKFLGLIKRRLSKRGSVSFDDRSNTLMITDLRENLEVLNQLLELIDVEPNIKEYLEQKKRQENSTFTGCVGGLPSKRANQ